MFGLSLGHILILLVVILLFGARRLPELGGALGKGLRSFKKGLEGRDEEEEKKKLNASSEGPDDKSGSNT